MESHALVKWCTDNNEVLIDKIAISKFNLADRTKGLKEGNVYTVKYKDGKKHKAELLITGKILRLLF